MLHRDEVQPRCLNVEVKSESLVLHTACSPWLVEELETDRGLQVFSRLPKREHQRLLEITRRPENVLSLAYTPAGVIIGQVTLAPLHGWGESSQMPTRSQAKSALRGAGRESRVTC